MGLCAAAKGPVAAFPAHWAPNDLMFYTGSQFDRKYAGGAFIAFHGSWNRSKKVGGDVMVAKFNKDVVGFARGVRDGTGDESFLAQHGVEQGGFADVR